MGTPKSDKATCRFCSKKILFVRGDLSDEQKEDCRKAQEEGKYPPHTRPAQKQWFHNERAWEIDLYCPDTVQEMTNTTWAGKEYKYFIGGKAAPKEFCTEDLKDKWEKCNKPVVSDSGEHLMCGIHWAMERRRIAEQDQREQEREIAEWARENRLKKEEAERKEREEREAKEKANLEKKLDVLRKVGLEFEISEPRRRRYWEPVPNSPDPTKVTVDLDALVAILNEER